MVDPSRGPIPTTRPLPLSLSLSPSPLPARTVRRTVIASLPSSFVSVSNSVTTQVVSSVAVRR